MKCTQYTSKEIASLLKCVNLIDGKHILSKDIKGFMYAECKPYDSACIVNTIAMKGSEVKMPDVFGHCERYVEEYVATSSRRIMKVGCVKIHSVVLLPKVSILPKNFITISDKGAIVADLKAFATGSEIEYAHSSKGDLYIKNSIKSAQMRYAFPFYFNASDAILASVKRA